MQKTFKVIIVIVGVLLIAGVSAHFIWLHNPEEHTLQLYPAKVYSNQSNSQYLITNANIVDVESGIIQQNKHLLIQDGRFTQIFEGGIPDSLTESSTLVDAKNQYLMPGIIDMHAHLNSGGLIPPDESTRSMALEQFARYGVSTIFTLGGHGFNEDITAGLIEKQRNHELVGPKIFAAGDILTAPEGYPIPLVPMMTGISADEIDLNEQGIITITESTDVDPILSQKLDLGLNGVKVMVESGLAGASEEPRISDETLQKIVQKASEYDLPVFAHVSRQDDMEDAINAGVDVIVHTVGDQLLTDAEPLFKKMKEDSIYYTPTLSIAHMYQNVASAEILDDPFLMQYSSKRTNRSLENWPIRQLMVKSSGIDPAVHKQKMMQNFSLLLEAGVPIMMGSDAGNPSVIPGYSAHKELEFMAKGGMANNQVLRSATIIPAKFLGIDDTSGSINEGKSASFIMLKENPLEDILNSQSIHRVMLEGYWVE